MEKFTLLKGNFTLLNPILVSQLKSLMYCITRRMCKYSLSLIYKIIFYLKGSSCLHTHTHTSMQIKLRSTEWISTISRNIQHILSLKQIDKPFPIHYITINDKNFNCDVIVQFTQFWLLVPNCCHIKLLCLYGSPTKFCIINETVIQVGS